MHFVSWGGGQNEVTQDTKMLIVLALAAFLKETPFGDQSERPENLPKWRSGGSIGV